MGNEQFFLFYYDFWKSQSISSYTPQAWLIPSFSDQNYQSLAKFL